MRSPRTLARDPASVAGKVPPIAEETDVLVIGAGVAGVAAALAAQAAGARVMLVDENPIAFKSMGEEVPLHFGGRMSAVLQNRNAALERVLEANPALVRALEAGIDVRLGTACFGLFPKHSSAAWVEVPVAGLLDAEHAYLVRFKRAIVAAGCRDMGLAFEGWQLPGVMGVNAAYRLSVLYGALDAKCAVLVGSDDKSLQMAEVLAARGVRIAAIVEQASEVLCSAEMLRGLNERGTAIFTRHVVATAVGDHEGVQRLVLVAVDAQGRHLPDSVPIACDTVLLGVASVPAIELLEAAGCAVRYDMARAGHAPRLEASQRTSIECIYAIGDCAGIWDEKTLDEEVSAREGRIAAAAAVRALGLSPDTQDEPVVAPAPRRDLAAGRLAWVRASVLNSTADPMVCQCEEVSADAILDLKPPPYVPLPDSRPEVAPSQTTHAVGGACPDLVKRLTRAGMGTCQGRRCREQVGALLALASGRDLCKVPHASYRTPVRPLPLAQLGALPESPAMDEHWDSWFGMPSQWIPFWRVAPSYTVANRGEDEAARE